MGVTSLGRHTRPACTQGFTRSLKLCKECGFNSCVRVFFIPWGHVENHAHIWAFVTSISHMGEMRDSDWSREILLRSDWLGPSVAIYTTSNFTEIRDIAFSYKHCNFALVGLLAKMASKTVTGSIHESGNEFSYNILYACCKSFFAAILL